MTPLNSVSIEFYLLAAGKGERAGGSKPLFPFGEMTVFERMVSSVRASGVRDVSVIGTDENAALKGLAASNGVKYLVNGHPELGMSRSILIAAENCTSEWLAVCPADMPLLTADAIGLCVAQLRRSSLQPVCDGRRRHPVFIPGAELDALCTTLQAGTLRNYLSATAVDEVHCSRCEQFDDFDTKEDYERLLKALSSFSPPWPK